MFNFKANISDIQHRVMASQNGRLIQEWLGERFP
jgi:hypothetical protein